MAICLVFEKCSAKNKVIGVFPVPPALRLPTQIDLRAILCDLKIPTE
jgi:hypothetical protein